MYHLGERATTETESLATVGDKIVVMCLSVKTSVTVQTDVCFTFTTSEEGVSCSELVTRLAVLVLQV